MDAEERKSDLMSVLPLVGQLIPDQLTQPLGTQEN